MNTHPPHERSAEYQAHRAPLRSRVRSGVRLPWARLDGRTLAAVAVLCTLHLTTRLVGLLSLPPFLDERLLISNARELASGSPALWSDPVTAGRFLTSCSIIVSSWLLTIPITLSPAVGTTPDILLAGRLATVFASLVAMLGIVALARTLWSSQSAVLAGLGYIFVPYIYFYDRMVMAEAYLTAGGLWTAVIAVQVARGKISNPIPLTVALTFAILAKPLPALFFVAVPIWTWLWFREADTSRRSLASIGRSYALIAVIGAVAGLLIGPSRFVSVVGANLSNVGGDQFGGQAPSLAEIPGHVVAYSGIFQGWFSDYFAPWSLALLVLAVLLAASHRDRAVGYSLLSGAAFILAFLIVPGEVASRYLVPGVALLAPGLGRAAHIAIRDTRQALGEIRSKGLSLGHTPAIVPASAVVLYLGVLIWGPGFQLQAVHDPSQLRYSIDDRRQYVEDWPSGYGFPEAMAWIDADVATGGHALLIGRYLNSNFETLAWLRGLDTLVVPELRYFAYPRELDEETRSYFSEKLRDPIFSVYYLEARTAREGPPKELMIETMRVVPVATFPKPGGLVLVVVYRVFPTPEWIASRTRVSFVGESREGRLSISTRANAPANQYVYVRNFVIGDDRRDVLYMHPTSSASLTAEIPNRARLEFSMALDPEAWDKAGDGVEYVVEVREGDRTDLLFRAHIDPANDPGQRRWMDESISLEQYGGKLVTITLSTHPHDSVDFDWGGWGSPRVVLP